MKLAYLSGPISAPTEILVYKNIIMAVEIAAELRLIGYSVICPHTTSMFQQSMLSYDGWIKQCLKQLSVCDVMFLAPGYENSRGCKIEIEYCENNAIPMMCAEIIDSNLTIIDTTSMRQQKIISTVNI